MSGRAQCPMCCGTLETGHRLGCLHGIEAARATPEQPKAGEAVAWPAFVGSKEHQQDLYRMADRMDMISGEWPRDSFDLRQCATMLRDEASVHARLGTHPAPDGDAALREAADDLLSVFDDDGAVTIDEIRPLRAALAASQKKEPA